MSLVKIEREGATAVMFMQSGENRFNVELVSAILSALHELEHDGRVRAVVITGSGKYFSNGLDLVNLAKLNEGQRKKFTLDFHAMLRKVGVFPKPTVCAINGHAFAGGAMLAALADFRYMRADRGWVCLPEVDIKLPFWPGMIALLEEAFSKPAFRHVAYSGKRYTAQELLKMGFIQGIFSNEELIPKCLEIAGELAKKNLSAYKVIKERMKADMLRIMDTEDPRYFF